MAESVADTPGIVLINLGSPDSPSVRDVRRYLSEFLSDPLVIDLPAILRWLLLHGIILRFRPQKSAHAYQSIWTDRGSPLVFHTADLADALQRRAGSEAVVRYAMRYGSPSVKSVCEALRKEGIYRIHFVPLYPQFAAATTATVMADVLQEVMRNPWRPLFPSIEPPFYDAYGFVELWARRVRRLSTDTHVLFSFHGLPVRQIRRSGDSLCMQKGCCERKAPLHCYRAQCMHSASAVARAARLKPENWSVAFQSRLGRDEWLTPSTEDLIREQAAKNRPLAIVPLSFVADCLETLEELAIRGEAIYREAGGRAAFTVLPSLNADEDWVDFLFNRLKKRVNALL
jgi:ferrochelatase